MPPQPLLTILAVNALQCKLFTPSLSLLPSSCQISNRELCLRNHLALAGLLNRTLVVPATPREVEGGYDYRLVFDFNHTRKCFGNDDVILTTHEYKERFGRPIRIDRVLCWHSPSDICNDPKSFPLLYFICPAVNVSSPDLPPSGNGSMAPTRGSQLVDGFAASGWFFSGHAVQLPEDRSIFAACLPVKAGLRSVVEAYSQVSDAVLVAGDLHNVHFAGWREFEASVDLPFAWESACPDALLVRPAEGMFQAASLAQQEMFGGEPYVSVHWRRGDFKEWCALHGKKDACYYPPRQVRQNRNCFTAPWCVRTCRSRDIYTPESNDVGSDGLIPLVMLYKNSSVCTQRQSSRARSAYRLRLIHALPDHCEVIRVCGALWLSVQAHADGHVRRLHHEGKRHPATRHIGWICFLTRSVTHGSGILPGPTRAAASASGGQASHCHNAQQ